MTVNQKCAVLVAVPVLSVVALVATGALTLRSANDGLDDIVGRHFVKLVEDEVVPLISKQMLPVIDEELVAISKLHESLELMLEADRDMHQALIAARTALAASGDDFAAADESNAENIQQAADRVEKASAQFHREEAQALYARFTQQFAEWRRASRSIVDGARADDSEDMAIASADTGAAGIAFDTARGSLDELQGLQYKEIEATLARIDEKKRQINAGHASMLEKKADAVNESRKIMTRTSTAANWFVILGIIMAVVVPAVGAFIARAMSGALKRIIAALTEGAGHVNDAAAQVSDASQQLAEGASEQASSLQETSSALEQMAAMTRTNAENAKQADEISDQTAASAQTGDQTMGRLNVAMSEINESSGQISKIIKVIEEIAFQTNLLALNAAVEAARAGEHGKGFAVVADEVRNLAQRAAQAAQETTGLIENSVSKAKEGGAVAQQVTQALSGIVGNVTKVSDLIADISRASQEQSQGVDQLNTAVAEIDRVTQQNASGAEESAAASQQLAAQAENVKGAVQELVAMVGGNGQSRPAPPAAGGKPVVSIQPEAKRIRRTKPSPRNPGFTHSDGSEFASAPQQDELARF